MAPIEQDMRRVLVLNTGGTIGMQASPKGYVCAPPGFLASFCRGMPMLHDKSFQTDAGDDMLVTPVSEFGKRALFKIKDYNPLLDSSNMTSTDWVRIARDVVAVYDDWDAFLVLHGTDTMAYTCSALSFMLQNLKKPIILTGSQIPLSRPRSDGVGNFLGALLVAGQFDIPEVCLYFADKLYRGNRCSKVDASALQAFDSPNMAPLASMGISCDVRWDLVRKPSPGKIAIEPGFCDDVVIIRVFPGPFNTLKHTLRPPLRGAVLQTFGAGNVPDQDPQLLEALREAYNNNIVVVNVTQCKSGAVEAHYATGRALAAVGVIAGRDMTTEAALVKLGWLLASGRKVDEVRSMMAMDMRGEMTINRTMQFSLHDGGFLRSVFSAIHDQGAPKAESQQALQKALVPTLLCAAAESGDLDAFRIMADDATTLNCADYDGRTALHLAAAQGHVPIVKFLLSQPADRCDPSPVDRWDNTPLLEAASHGHVDVVKMLVESGTKLGLPEHKLAGILCSRVHAKDHTAVACLAVAKADLSAAGYDGRTALHIAASEGNVDAVSLLLEGGATLDIADRWGRTPLDEATMLHNPAAVADQKGSAAMVMEMLRDGASSPKMRKVSFEAV